MLGQTLTYSEALAAAQAARASSFDWYDPSTGQMTSTQISYTPPILTTTGEPLTIERPANQIAGFPMWGWLVLGGIGLSLIGGKKSHGKRAKSM